MDACTDAVWQVMGLITQATRISVCARTSAQPQMTFGRSGGRKSIVPMDRGTEQAISQFLEESGWQLVTGRDNVTTAIWHKR